MGYEDTVGRCVVSASRAYSVLVGVDPGLTTGVGVYRVDRDLADARCLPPMEAVDLIAELLATERDVAVAVELFTLGGRRRPLTHQPDALEVTGAVRWLARRSGAPFRSYAAASAAAVTDAATLNRLGWRAPGDPDHVTRAFGQVTLLLRELRSDAALRVFRASVGAR